MADIGILIHDLQNADLEDRYAACKSLWEQDQLPPEAVNALQEAAADPEPLVSVTARRALLRHEPRAADPDPIDELNLDLQRPFTSREIFQIIALSVVIALLTIPLISIIFDDRFNDLWFISFPTLFLAGYISYLSFKDGRQRRLLAILSSAALGLLSGIIIFLLLSGLFLLAVSAYFGS